MSAHRGAIVLPGLVLARTPGASAFAYALNDPPNRVDPSGFTCEPKRCGPEVGGRLDATLRSVIKRWNGLSSFRKWVACENVFGLWGIRSDVFGVWDIYFFDNVPANCNNCTTDPDDACISVFGVKGWFWDVNYTLYGLIERLM